MSVFGLGFLFYWGLKSPRFFFLHGTHPFILVLFLALAAVLWMLSWGLLAYNHLNITCSRRGMASVAGTALNHTNLTLRAHICAYIKHILCIQASSLFFCLSDVHVPLISFRHFHHSSFLCLSWTIYISQTSIYFSFLSLSHTSICIYIFSLSPSEAFLFLPFTHAHTCTFSLLSPSYSHFFPPPQTHSHSPYTLSHPNPICLSVCLSFYFILEEYLRLWHTG